MNEDSFADRTSIGNVGILDMRRASEESISSVGTIGNVGMLLYSAETAGMLSRITGMMGNLGRTVEASAEAEVHQGQTEFTRDYFSHRDSPLRLLALGRVVVNPDVPEEDIENGLSDLWITGDLVCPEHLLGIITSKTRHLGGKTIGYRSEDRLLFGLVTLDETFLRAMSDATGLAVIGTLDMPDVVPDDLLERKLRTLQVTGKVRLREENAQAVLRRIVDGQRVGNVTTIPAGYQLVSKEFTLDAAVLKSLSSKKLYCAQTVRIDPDLDPATLDAGLEALRCEGMVVCPAGLAEVVRRKCNDPSTQLAVYDGELWTVSSVMELAASRFEYLEGKAALLVTGVLTISPDIDPAVLADRLSVVHNVGVIQCSPEQLGAIQARLGIATGVLGGSAVSKEEMQDDRRSGRRASNAGYLALSLVLRMM